MRIGYVFFLVVSVVLLAAAVGLVVFRIVNGPTNILFPGLGLVVALEVIIIALLVLDGIAFGLAMIFRSRTAEMR
jgi:hypothetical protein